MKDNQDLLFGAGGVVLFRAKKKRTELETEARYLKEIAKSAEALRERTEALERSNRELEQFAYVASHDLQEPLCMVASYTQLLAKRYKGKLDTDADVPRPELILLDLNLPRKDGREVLAEIKGNGDLKRIPVVVLTTSRSEQDILKSYDLSANCYITKPVDLDQFISVVRSINEFWLSIVKLPGEVESW
ncbi:unnamed protein product [marine sediment metagenome]|uniref:Response regulatory domain-containing protein n=1 Tax=marine sediment metagenome TaxID=412755 RepID=X1JB69_9ZZZZ